MDTVGVSKSGRRAQIEGVDYANRGIDYEIERVDYEIDPLDLRLAMGPFVHVVKHDRKRISMNRVGRFDTAF